MFRRNTIPTGRQRIASRAQPTFRYAHSHPNVVNTIETPDAKTEEDVSPMITYSTFDPCSFRPLSFPLRSGIAMPMPTLSGSEFPGSENEKTIREEAGEEGKEKEEKGKAVFKPWPYSLPSWLQPKAGTTFSLMNDSTGPNSTATKSTRTGVLQALLYGVPDPERFSYTQEMVAPGSLLHKVLHGVKEMDDGEAVVAVVSVMAVKKEDVEMCEDEVVVVKDVEVKVQVEDVLEKNSGCAQGIIAK